LINDLLGDVRKGYIPFNDIFFCSFFPRLEGKLKMKGTFTVTPVVEWSVDNKK
jgi:hypothetical protein